MRHKNKQKFGEGRDHRRKLLRSLASSLILREKIATTTVNARVLKPYAEKLITRAKVNSLSNLRILNTKVTLNAAKKLLEVFGPKFQDRKGGYLRLTKITQKNAPKSEVMVEFVE